MPCQAVLHCDMTGLPILAILLLSTTNSAPKKKLAFGNVVAGIQHLGNGLGLNLAFHSAHIVARVEALQVEFPGGLGPPQPHVDDVVVAKAGHKHVAGHGHDNVDIHPARAVVC